MTSNARLVLVRTLVGLRVSDSTPRRGSLVTFSGSVFPAHDGTRALIQRRTSTGGWVTVARAEAERRRHRQVDLHRASASSATRVYRVKVPGDGDHVNGFSRLRTLTVHG